MTTPFGFVTESDAQHAQAKVQTLYDSMPAAEQKILQTIVELASEDGEVQGYLAPCCAFHLTVGPSSPAGMPTIGLTLPQIQISPSDFGPADGRH